MQDRPSPSELVAAVARFLREDLAPKLEGHDAFQLRVACNALDLVERQAMLEPALDRAEAERLRTLLGREGELAEMNDELSELVARGAIGIGSTALVEHLWATTLAKLAVDQPTYGAYKREANR
jgi:DNA-binding response OmpR family regulator